MYIWLVHNLVTERLAKPHGYVADVFYPPKSVCPKCRKGGKYPDVDWDNNAVWEYLQVYCLEDEACLSRHHKLRKGPPGEKIPKMTGGKIPFSHMALPLAGVTLVVMLGAGLAVYAYKRANVQPKYAQVPGHGAAYGSNSQTPAYRG